MKLPELLAPAGSHDALKAAVAAGADAVYLSGKRFGARRYAANFDKSELKEAVDYAHQSGVKVYVTVNTLIRDDELGDVADYLIWLYEIGADAVLVQDVGVASLARRVIPELDLHASTQMTIHNSAGATWAERIGMKRVVLAREVSLEEAKKMSQRLEIGLEVFVHGALCYCYSGQCLLSSVIGGRSGNRGMCAQPCRKPYVLLRGDKDEHGRPVNLAACPMKDRFLISTRDLAVYRQLEKIVNSPIRSLKIEGRMKSAEYVAIVTDVYRRALDAIALGRWSPSIEDQRDLALAFNRDFTEGYLMGSKEIMGREMSDNRGLILGVVSSYDKSNGEAVVRLAGPLGAEQGDGLVIQSPGQEIGVVVRRPPLLKDGLQRFRVPERVRPGARVYLTSSVRLSRHAEKIASSAPAQTPIDLEISWDDGVPIVEVRLNGSSGPIRIRLRAGFRMEKALNKPLMKEQIEAQIRRTGGTSFRIAKLEMSYPGGLFAPLGNLNQLRRDILARAREALLDAQRPNVPNVDKAKERLGSVDLAASAKPQRRIPSLAVYADSLEIVLAAVEGGCKRIYFEPNLFGTGKKEIESLLQDAKDLCIGCQLIWKWPGITKDSNLESAVPLLARVEVDGVMVGGSGAAEAVSLATPKMLVSGSSSLNVWNHQTVQQLGPLFHRLTLSPELSRDQLAILVARARLYDAPEMELVVQGNLEVMVAEDCIPVAAFKDKDATRSGVFWGLQDFKRIFPLWLDSQSRTHILNAAETCLLDYMPKLFEIGLDGIAIDARNRTGRYALEMVQIYREAIDLTAEGGASLDMKLQLLKERIRPMALGGLTYGHFLKGLKDELT